MKILFLEYDKTDLIRNSLVPDIRFRHDKQKHSFQNNTVSV